MLLKCAVQRNLPRLTTWSVNRFSEKLQRQPGSNQSQNKSAEIKQSSSIYASFFFARECERKPRKPFVPRNCFTLTCSSGTRYPECASSIHTTVSTRPGECKVSRSYVSTRGPHSGGPRRRGQAWLYGAIETFGEEQADSNPR